MTETFTLCRQSLLDLLLLKINSIPTQEELESLLRITPQGIAKINVDLNRGIAPHEILNELATTLHSLKEFDEQNKYDIPQSSFMETDRNFTPEEKLAIHWSTTESYFPFDCCNIHEIILNIIWEYRKCRLKSELKQNAEKGKRVIISDLAPTSSVNSTDYVVRRLLGPSEQILICVNPMFCWFDLSIRLEPHHFRFCQIPSLLESVHEDQGLEHFLSEKNIDLKSLRSMNKNSFESLQIPYRTRRVRFADLETDNDFLDNEELPVFKIQSVNAVRIPSPIDMESNYIRISDSKKFGVVFRLNSFFERIRRPSIKTLWRNGH